jgi:membrane-bound lytic murein transglycosylase A
VPVPWSDLPGWNADSLAGVWSAWMASCQRAVAPWVEVCAQASAVAAGSDGDKRAWMQGRLQAYRVESLQGVSLGLLTAYFEPVFEARRTRSADYSVPLYQPPVGITEARPGTAARK